jgi:hypothetical protein
MGVRRTRIGSASFGELTPPWVTVTVRPLSRAAPQAAPEFFLGRAFVQWRVVFIAWASGGMSSCFGMIDSCCCWEKWVGSFGEGEEGVAGPLRERSSGHTARGPF